MSIHNGLILYNIERNGCLNGVYTNENGNGEISNEILKKLDGEAHTISGTYSSAYFEHGQQAEKSATLTISPHKTGVFLFSWRDKNGNKIFQGIGYQMNDRQIVVRYATTDVKILG